mgnify:CR=1 FL=1|tara:strand:- start:200 stop:880 length:681 start_codon:yes stop_codon:yes gene_type:complete
MARISSYPFDLDVTDKDAWIGSDAGSRQTKQFTAEAVAKYLNIKGKISISAQMIFKFRAVAAQPGDFTGPADGATFASITTMQLSIVDVSGQNVVKFMEYLVGNNILISKQNQISTFGHYTIDSYTDNGGFYTLNLTNLKGEGALEDKAVYDFALFTLSSQGSPTFIFTQGVPATTWNILHNLGKFPSVSVTNNNNIVVNGEVTYIDNNNVQINFSAGFSGKAYLN